MPFKFTIILNIVGFKSTILLFQLSYLFKTKLSIWNNFRFTKYLYRQYKEFLWTFCPVFPNVDTLHDYSTLVKTKKLTLVHYCSLNSSLPSNLINFHQCLFSIPGSNPAHHIAFSHHVSFFSSDLWQILSLVLSFMTLKVLKNTHYFVECSSIWVFRMIFS